MDLSIVGYIMLLVLLVVAVLFFSGKVTKKVVNTITIILLAVFSVVVVVDLELYRNWGYRIDAAPIFYLKTPGEAIASVKGWFVVLFSLFSILLFSVSYFVYTIAVGKTKLAKAKWWSIPIFVFFASTMIIPIRGGFGIAPMNPGKVFFSSNLFSNHASLNVVWNLIHSITKSGKMYKEYPNYAKEAESKQFYESLNIGKESADEVLNCEKPNVVIILLESFTAKVIEPLGGVEGVTPNFTKLSDEGLLFTSIYASGDRSDKGIIAVLSGFPAQSTQSVIKHTVKASKLPSISNSLYKEGYSTTFYYGGDPDFANIRSFLYNANFKSIVTQDDFPKPLRSSKWGVHDEHLFKRLLTDLDSARAPSFKLLFTLSSHEPFDFPGEQAYPATSEENKFLSSVNYSDKWLGWFFDQAKQKSWYDNTLFVLIADHGHRYPGSTPYYESEKFAIPMLWIGGALDTIGTNNQIGGQVDLAQTLLYQLGVESGDYFFSRNLLSNKKNPFAYYVFNDGFGFVTSEGLFVWDHVGQRTIVDAPNDSIKQTAFLYFSNYQRYFLGL